MKVTSQIFVAHLLHSHILAGEHCAEIDLSAFKAKATTVGDGNGSVVKRILKLAEAAIRAG